MLPACIQAENIWFLDRDVVLTVNRNIKLLGPVVVSVHRNSGG